MNKKVLIVEDQFVEANDLQLMLRKAGYDVCGIARSVPIARELIKKENPDLVLLDIYLKGVLTGIDLAKELKEDNIAFIYLSANSNQDTLSAAKTTEPYGFIVKPFREKDLLVTLEIAQYRHEHSRESKSRRENVRLKKLEELAETGMQWNERLLQVASIIQPEIPFEFMSVGFDNEGSLLKYATSFLRIGFNEYQPIGIEELATISRVTKDEIRKMITVTEREPLSRVYAGQVFQEICKKGSINQLIAENFQMNSFINCPQTFENGDRFGFQFYSRRPLAFNSDHLTLLNGWSQALAANLKKMPRENAGSNADINAGISKFEKKKEKTSIPGNQTEVTGFKFNGIIGNSHLLLTVFDSIGQVAPFDTTVLLLGESGTGKERIAESIHNCSARKEKLLVKINCAALPATLIESELFGHEKGSFTGATDKRIGKFEQANGGTIFLDEIGDMPIDLQVKLLRVLQEQEIEPVGGTVSKKIDVRVIAATNKNLEKEVADGRFRLDLYYRLNVFPIVLPSLRERVEDIPALTSHFISIYNAKSGKQITGVSDRVQKSMEEYSWPGNIRELENIIQRGVLQTKGDLIEELSFPAFHKREIIGDSNTNSIKTIHENERDHITAVLKRCNGRVWGKGGAAEVLNIPATTLRSKMKRLGIGKSD